VPSWGPVRSRPRLTPLMKPFSAEQLRSHRAVERMMRLNNYGAIEAV